MTALSRLLAAAPLVPTHVSLYRAQRQLARLALASAQPELGVQCLVQAAAAATALLPAMHPEVGCVRVLLGNAWGELAVARAAQQARGPDAVAQAVAEARTELQRAAIVLRVCAGADHPATIATLEILGRITSQSKR
jgi:hypothetical protein